MVAKNNAGQAIFGRNYGDTARSGQTTVATAGTAVQLSSTNVPDMSGVYIKALSTNTGSVYIGNDGADDVTSSNGYELEAGESIFINESLLSKIYVDAANNGDKVAYLIQ